MIRLGVALLATVLVGTAIADDAKVPTAEAASIIDDRSAALTEPDVEAEVVPDVAPDVASDAEAGADQAFRAAQQLAARGDPESVARALEAFERLGAARPVTRWTDDAWAEAARLAELSGDHGRARRALAQVIATGTDTRLVRRARAALARLDAATEAGRWDAVAATHERLVNAVFGGDDPRAELAELEALVAEHPAYPRASAVRLAIARGWEQEGQPARALRWYRAAADSAPVDTASAARLELVRALIRAGALDEATAELGRVRDLADPVGVARTVVMLRRAHLRAWLRPAAWLVLAILLAAVLVSLRRALGSVSRVVGRLARPPSEALFLAPLALALVVTASAGNPLVARAVRDLAVGGVLLAWLSGVAVDAARGPRRRLSWLRLALHVGLVLVAVTAMTYLALDRDHLLSHLGETWRAGPNLR